MFTRVCSGVFFTVKLTKYQLNRETKYSQMLQIKLWVSEALEKGGKQNQEDRHTKVNGTKMWG